MFGRSAQLNAQDFNILLMYYVPRGTPRCGLPSIVMLTFVPLKADMGEASYVIFTTNCDFA